MVYPFPLYVGHSARKGNTLTTDGRTDDKLSVELIVTYMNTGRNGVTSRHAVGTVGPASRAAADDAAAAATITAYTIRRL